MYRLDTVCPLVIGKKRVDTCIEPKLRPRENIIICRPIRSLKNVDGAFCISLHSSSYKCSFVLQSDFLASEWSVATMMHKFGISPHCFS